MALCSAASRLALGGALLLAPLATGCANDFDGLFRDGGTSGSSGSSGGTDGSTSGTLNDQICNDPSSCAITCAPGAPCRLFCLQEHAKCVINGCTPTKCPNTGESTVVVCNGAPCLDAGGGG
jgi:hypothetical protein